MAQLEAAHVAQTQSQSIVSGFVGGFSLVGASHPFDLVKVLKQTSHQPNSSTLKIAQDILHNQGIRGLYTGVQPVLAATPFILSFNYWLFHELRRTLTVNGQELSLARVGVAASLSAIPIASIVSPAEHF